MTTKRIKIERPEDLREGMRVEVLTEEHEETMGVPVVGFVYKCYSRPGCPMMGLDMYENNWRILIDYSGEFHNDIVSIHRLIDGIEDVVVGDILISDNHFVKVLEVRSDLVHISSPAYEISDPNKDQFKRHHSIYTMYELIDTGHQIYIPEEQKTELTETEAKEIIAEQKGVEPEDIVIKKDE